MILMGSDHTIGLMGGLCQNLVDQTTSTGFDWLQWNLVCTVSIRSRGSGQVFICLLTRVMCPCICVLQGYLFLFNDCSWGEGGTMVSFRFLLKYVYKSLFCTQTLTIGNFYLKYNRPICRKLLACLIKFVFPFSFIFLSIYLFFSWETMTNGKENLGLV